MVSTFSKTNLAKIKIKKMWKMPGISNGYAKL